MIKEVIGKKLRHIREISGITQDELASKVDVTNEYISMIESGKRLPRLDILAKLADAFNLDVNYFISEMEPDFSIILRAEGLKREDKRELLKFIKLSDNYAFLENLTDNHPELAPIYPDPPFEHINDSLSLYSYAEKMAKQERSRLGLGDEPIRDIFSLIETQGAHVIRKHLKGSNIDGSFVFNEKKGAYILVNSSRTKGRQVFTAAHEYCHYIKDRDKGPQIDWDFKIEMRINDNDKTRIPIELIANAFAACFLMPGATLRRLVRSIPKNRVGPEEVIYLKRYFGVSYESMLIRLKRLDYLREDDIELYKQIKPLALEMAIYNSSSDSKVKDGMPERYLRLSLDAYLNGSISISKLKDFWSNFLNIDVITVKDILSKTGLLRRRKEFIEEGSL